jgi:hypothetical protein
MKRPHIFLAQALYYFATGLWPVIDIVSFMKVTGPKTDIWLVKMVGLLTVAIAITLFFSYKRSNRTLTVLSVTAAMAYAAIDIYYYLYGTLRAVYIGDAVMEVLIVAFVLFTRSSKEC